MADMKPNDKDPNPSGGTKLPSFKSSLSKKNPSLSTSGKKGTSGGPAAIPTWGSTGPDKLAGAPMFRGAAAMAGKKSLFGRLKALKTKDMAFIAAGLGVLVMAPVAEYLISDSEDGGTQLSEGFDRKGGFFAEPQDLYEAGLEGIAPGGLMGRDTDVITPLNVRDPSSLIMAPGGQQEEPVASTPVPEVKRDAVKQDDTDWKKIIDSAKSGVKEASKKVKLPRPNSKLAGALSGLKGLAGGGNTRASMNLSAPRTPGARAPGSAGSNLSRTQAVPGFRGTGGRSMSGTGGDTSGGFGRASNPGGTTGTAASATGGINGGGTGTGYGRPGGEGTPTKNPGGNGTKDNKTLGENLAFLRAKMNMEKAIDLKWAKKRYNELERKKMLEQMAAQTAQQVLLKLLDRLLKGNEGKKEGGGSGGGSGGGKGDPKGGDPDATKDGSGKFPKGTFGKIGEPSPKVPATNSKKGFSAVASMKQTALGKVARLDATSAELDSLKTGGPAGPTITSAKKAVTDAKAALTQAINDAEKAAKPVEARNTELGTRNEAIGKVVEGIEPLETKGTNFVKALTTEGADPDKKFKNTGTVPTDELEPFTGEKPADIPASKITSESISKVASPHIGTLTQAQTTLRSLYANKGEQWDKAPQRVKDSFKARTGQTPEAARESALAILKSAEGDVTAAAAQAGVMAAQVKQSIDLANKAGTASEAFKTEANAAVTAAKKIPTTAKAANSAWPNGQKYVATAEESKTAVTTAVTDSGKARGKADTAKGKAETALGK